MELYLFMGCIRPSFWVHCLMGLIRVVHWMIILFIGYADCLLLLAQAKAFLGEDPVEEINAVRKRAYGEDYFNAHPEVQYPNDNDAALYADNKSVKPDNVGAMEAVLKERMREFMVEGKRWYDLRLAGDEYVLEHTTAEATRLLWPIDKNTLTNNSALKQTPGYESSGGK